MKTRKLFLSFLISLVLLCSFGTACAKEEECGADSMLTEKEITDKAVSLGLYELTGKVLDIQNNLLKIELMVINEETRISFGEEDEIAEDLPILLLDVSSLTDKRSLTSLKILQKGEYVIVWYQNPLEENVEGKFLCNSPVYIIRKEGVARLV